MFMTLNIKNSIDNIGKKIITFPNNFHFSCTINGSPNEALSSKGKDGGNKSKNNVTKDELNKKAKENDKKIKEMQDNLEKHLEQEGGTKKVKDLMKELENKSKFTEDPDKFVDELNKILSPKEFVEAERKSNIVKAVNNFRNDIIRNFEDGEQAPDLKKTLDLLTFSFSENDEEKKKLLNFVELKEGKESLWVIFLSAVIGVVIGSLGVYLFDSKVKEKKD